MHALVIGAGLSGLTSAWFLRSREHHVTVIDRAEGPGLETSFANGALLTPSMSDPWNSPGCWRTLLASLGRDDAALQLRLRALPGLVSWGTRFLWHSAPSRHASATSCNRTLACRSMQVLAGIASEIEVDFAYRSPGSLRLFRDRAAITRAAAAAKALGLSACELTPREVVRIEPGLDAIGSTLAGAIHYPADAVGDAHLFCVGLATALRECGVEFLWEQRVSSLERRGDEIAAAIVDGARLKADTYLVATASHAPHLLRNVGIRLPIAPAKGYSLTVPLDGASPISVPLIDDDLHAVVVAVGNVLRVAGTAEFAGYDESISPARIDNLVALVNCLLPTAELDLARASPWCGLRAMSSDGVPFVGATRLGNLFVNTGHGHLGWTMAAGAGQLVADLIDGRSPGIEPAPYSPARVGC